MVQEGSPETLCRTTPPRGLMAKVTGEFAHRNTVLIGHLDKRRADILARRSLAPHPTASALYGVLSLSRSIKGMRVVEAPLCSRIAPEYSLAGGAEPERVAVSVVEAPAAREDSTYSAKPKRC